jgi:cytochrome c556
MTIEEIEKLLSEMVREALSALESLPKVKEKSQPFDCEEIEKALNALNEHTFKVSE